MFDEVTAKRLDRLERETRRRQWESTIMTAAKVQWGEGLLRSGLPDRRQARPGRLGLGHALIRRAGRWSRIGSAQGIGYPHRTATTLDRVGAGGRCPSPPGPTPEGCRFPKSRPARA